MSANLPNWERAFVVCLRAHPGVQLRFDRLLRGGMDREIALRLLQAATLPARSRANGKVNLRSPIQDFADKWIPSQQRAIDLASMLRRSARELLEFSSNAVVLMDPESFVVAKATARRLCVQAEMIEELPWAEVRKRLSYKEFWQYLPWAMLFAAFKPPKTLSYEDLSQLLKAAMIAHGGKSSTGQRSDPLSPDALKQKHSRLARAGFVPRGAALLRAFFSTKPPS